METSWRLHLSDRTIQHLDLLPGTPPLLGAWARRDRVSYHHLETGVASGEAEFVPPDLHTRDSLDWQNFITTLTAPNQAGLTLLRLPQAVLRLTRDKQFRLFRSGATALYLQSGGRPEVKLEAPDVAGWLAVDLDSRAGRVAALDQAARLHLYHAHEHIGSHDIGLQSADDLRPLLALAREGNTAFVTDRQRILRVDQAGVVQAQARVTEQIGRLAVAPDGGWLAVSDLEIGIIRVYEGTSLTLTHQRFVTDLLAEARQLQLIASEPPQTFALSALAINDNGVLALAVSGVVCVCSVHHQFKKLPAASAAPNVTTA